MALIAKVWKVRKGGKPVFMRVTAGRKELELRVASPLSKPRQLLMDPGHSRVFPIFAVPGNPLEIQERLF